MEKNNKNIELAAYYLWQNSGCPEGRSEEFWYAAINQINGCGCAKKACTKSAQIKKCATSRSAKTKSDLK
ncbi:MAG: DUF2934 domain-containing protein [Alphaproteobacteria bacterium]